MGRSREFTLRLCILQQIQFLQLVISLEVTLSTPRGGVAKSLTPAARLSVELRDHRNKETTVGPYPTTCFWRLGEPLSVLYS